MKHAGGSHHYLFVDFKVVMSNKQHKNIHTVHQGLSVFTMFLLDLHLSFKVYFHLFDKAMAKFFTLTSHETYCNGTQLKPLLFDNFPTHEFTEI